MAKSVLLIEDKEGIREPLAVILEIEGYAVTQVSNGREALQWLSNSPEPPGLILLDLIMPGMSGYEFRTEQVNRPAFADIPVIVFSATLKSAAEENGSLAGVRDVLEKPVDLDVLMSTVEKYCA